KSPKALVPEVPRTPAPRWLLLQKERPGPRLGGLRSELRLDSSLWRRLGERLRWVAGLRARWPGTRQSHSVLLRPRRARSAFRRHLLQQPRLLFGRQPPGIDRASLLPAAAAAVHPFPMT